MKNIIIVISVSFIILSVGCSDFEGSVNRFNNKLRGTNETLTEANESISIGLSVEEEPSTKRTSDLHMVKEVPKEMETQKEIDVCEFKHEDSESNDLCYLKFSEKYPDNFYCNYFVDESLKNDCRTDWALKKNDTHFCRIQPLDSSIDCYNKFFGIRANVDICNVIIDLKLKKCLSEVNLTVNLQEREPFCNGEDKANSWNDCMWRIAVATKDKSWCVKAYNDYECYLIYAKSTLDESACGKINWKIDDDKHNEDTEEEKKLVEEMETGELRGECYTYVAIEKKDKTICEKIPPKVGRHSNRVNCRLAVP